MDTYLKKLKKDLSTGPSITKVAVSYEEANNLATKISQHALIKSYQIQNIDKYTFFLILNTKGWREKYLREIEIYDAIFRLLSEYLDEIISPYDKGRIVLFPSKIYNFAKALPEYSENEVIEAFQGHWQIINDTIGIGPDQLITAEILNQFLEEKKEEHEEEHKIDVDFWVKAFEYFREKDVINKYKHHKEKHLPDTLMEMIEYEDQLPSKLISYARTTCYRLYNDLKKKEPKFPNLYNSLSDDLGAQELNEKLELEAVIERIEGVVKTLTPTEQKVIELEFSNELTQKDIALKLGISQQAVSKHRLKLLEKLKSAAMLPSD